MNTVTWPELPRAHSTAKRGLAWLIRLAIAATASLCASKPSASAGISAISRAIAVCPPRSAILAAKFVDRGAQVAAVPPERSDGVLALHSGAKQDRDLHVAVRLLDIARGVCGGATRDLRHHPLGAAAQLGIAGAHMHHQSAIDAAEPHHHRGREQVEHDLLRGAGFHPGRAGYDFCAGVDCD